MVKIISRGKLTLAGLLYGLSLASIGLLEAGAGHGSYLLLGIAAAPLSFGGIRFSLIAPLILWTTVGCFLSSTYKSPQRQIFVLLLGLHYFAVPFVSLFRLYSDPVYIAEAWKYNPLMLVLGFAVYLLGQVMLWLLWFRFGKTSATDGEQTVEKAS